jgi:hypothetical protein
VEERLAGVHPDELTPKAALELVYELKALTTSGSRTDADLRGAQETVVDHEADGHDLEDVAGLGAVGTGASNIA